MDSVIKVTDKFFLLPGIVSEEPDYIGFCSMCGEPLEKPDSVPYITDEGIEDLTCFFCAGQEPIGENGTCCRCGEASDTLLCSTCVAIRIAEIEKCLEALEY